MAFTKITPEDRQGKGNVGQPDTPLLTTTEMQEQMDSLANLGIDKFNNFIDEISDKTASNNIGCIKPEGISSNDNLTAVLAAIVADYQVAKTNAHFHSNSTQLNTINDTFMTDVGRIRLLLASIQTIDALISGESLGTGLPTSLAVKNFVEGYDYKTIIREAIYPIGAVYQTTFESPDTVFGTTGKWTLISTDSNGIKSYKRIG